MIWEVAKLIARTVTKELAFGWVSLAGVMSGVAVMYAQHGSS